MAMTPLPGGLATYENPSIMVSDNGTVWTVPDGLTNPIDASPTGGYYNSDPCLLMDDNTLYCYYREADGANEDRIRVKTSTDGVTWSDEAALFTTVANKSISPKVLKIGSTYTMFLFDNVENKIVKRTCSTPAGTWSEPADCTITGGGSSTFWHFDIVPSGSRLYMVYNNDSRDFYLAYSDDNGATWTSAPFRLMTAASGTWDAYLYKPCMVANGSNFDMWYGAYSADETAVWKIGKTTLQIGQV